MVAPEIEGDVPNTKAPEPVSPVTAAARFAEDGVASQPATFVPSPVIAPTGSAEAFVRLIEAGVPITAPEGMVTVPVKVGDAKGAFVSICV